MVELAVRKADPAVEGEPVTWPAADPCDQLAGLTRAELVTVVRARQARLLEAEAAMAAALAAVGDCGGDPDDGNRDDPRSERLRFGPDGMPGSSEFAGAEIGPILQRTPNGADLEIRSMLVSGTVTPDSGTRS